MKNKTLKLVLLVSILFFSTLLFFSNNSLANGNEIDKIEINIPEPVIGRKLTTNTSRITVKANDELFLSIDEVRWLCNKYDTLTNQYIGYQDITDLTKECNDIDKYSLCLSFLVPNTYIPSSDIEVTVNGVRINSKNFEELNWGSYGDVNNDGVAVSFEFGKAKPVEEISKIEITTPGPVIGQKLTTDTSRIAVKANGELFLPVDEVRWLCNKYDTSTNQYKGYQDITDLTKECNDIDKYSLCLSFLVPNTYIPSSDLEVTVNGVTINSKNFEELNWGSYGNINNDGVVVSFEFGKAELPTKVSYTTHVQNIGWQGYVSNGQMAGTSGKSLRLEGIKIKLENQEYSGNIEYKTHIQNIGWESSFKKNDEMSGTTGQSLRLEAIEIKLTGEMANHYDIYYRVHSQNLGWLGWARNGERSGTAGYAYRLEGIEIILIEKGTIFSDYGKSIIFYDTVNGSIKPVSDNAKVGYKTHVQDIGWQDYVYDGEVSGTSGRLLRLEGINIKLLNPEYSGNIEYRTHIQNIGWESSFKKNDEMSGTTGQSLRLEAIEIKLTGEMANHYDIYYRVHTQNIGWMNWAKNGEKAGSAGYAYRLEGIEIVLVNKGETPPERTDMNTVKSFIQR